MGVEWKTLRVHDLTSLESEKMFNRLSQFIPTPIKTEVKAANLAQLKGSQYAELLAPYDSVNDFSTSSILKEKGENLTSERLSKMSIEEMVKAILAKSGIVSFTRVMRIVRDALVM